MHVRTYDSRLLYSSWRAALAVAVLLWLACPGCGDSGEASPLATGGATATTTASGGDGHAGFGGQGLGGSGGTAGVAGSAGHFVGCPATLPSGMIACEDFENASLGPLPEIDPTATGQISRAARPFWGRHLPEADGGLVATGCNPGQCAMAYVGPYVDPPGVSYSEPKWRFDNTIGGGQEVYVRFDLRVAEDLGTSNAAREIYNFKFIKITDYSAAPTTTPAGYYGANLNLEPGDGSYSWYGWAGDEYYMHRATTKLPNSIMDNQWHTFEVYIHVGSQVVADKDDPAADGIVRLWEDGVLILEDTAVPMRLAADQLVGINSMAFIRHAKAAGAPVSPLGGHVFFDNLEVWDRHPN